MLSIDFSLAMGSRPILLAYEALFSLWGRAAGGNPAPHGSALQNEADTNRHSSERGLSTWQIRTGEPTGHCFPGPIMTTTVVAVAVDVVGVDTAATVAVSLGPHLTNDLSNEHRKQAAAWLDEHFPGWQDEMALWD